MDVLILGAKSALAVMLIIAGGAKLADVSSFAATMRLFMPWQPRRSAMRCFAVGVAVSEVALGTASLSWPAANWLNTLTVAAACLFFVITSVGYVLYRGRTCRCFGALSQRKFGKLSVLRSLGMVTVAVVAMFDVRLAAVELSEAARSLLAVSAVFLTLAALAAANAMRTIARTESRLTVR